MRKNHILPRLCLLIGIAVWGTGPAAAGDTALKSVIIVYKTHFDIGYTAMARDVIHEYRTEMADRVLDAIQVNQRQPKDQQFVWTLSGWPMQQILWEGQTPDRRKKLKEALAAGNLAVHAFPFTLQAETAEPEDIVRGLGISSALNRQFNRPLSTAAKMSDVPGQSWIFPTIFTHAGIRFYHMGGPLVNKSFNLPPMFWWEGPDGSRLLTLYNNGYGSDKLPPPNWPYKHWVYISMTGDNQGPPPPDTVREDIAFYKEKGIHATVGRLDDFAEAVLSEDLSGLPVVRSDIPDPWVYGLMSMPEAVRKLHHLRPQISALDQLTTLETLWGIFRPARSNAITNAYTQSLLFSEHTFGLANQHYITTPFGNDWEMLRRRGLPPQFQIMEESWREKADHVEEVDRLTSEPYQDALRTLADNINLPDPRIVVYNPLAWRRDGEVCLNVFHLSEGLSLKPVDGGAPIAIAKEGPGLETPYRVIRFFAKDIPAMGYRTYVVSQEKPAPIALAGDAASGVIESPFFRAVMDAKKGCIQSLIDKGSGRELVDQKAPYGFGQYLYERFGSEDLKKWTEASLYPQYEAHKQLFSAYNLPEDTPYASGVPKDMNLSVAVSAIDVTAILTGTLSGPGEPQEITLRLTLSGETPTADVEVAWRKAPDSWPEAGWICFPFAVENPKFCLGRLGADLDPVQDMTIDYANYHFSWINTGAAVFDENTGAGAAICPLDSPMISLGEPGEYRFEKRYTPAEPYLYVNLYNNHWRTNFAAWIGRGERMSSRVRIWAFDSFNAEGALYTPAMESRVPLAAARTTARPGALPTVQEGIALSRKGVAVSAFGPNPDGPGTIVRLWEQAGQSGDLTVTLPAAMKITAIHPVNLRGEIRTDEPAPAIHDNAFRFPLKAYAPASFVVE